MWKSLWRKALLTLALASVCVGFSQQQATLSGRIESLGELPQTARVGVHVIDAEGVTLAEVASVRPVASTFSLTTTTPSSTLLQPFSAGAVLLPGLQNEYQVTPAGAQFARAVTKVYDDTNTNSIFDNPESDPVYLGVASVDNPVGFFVLLYVDQPVTLSGRGQTLNMTAGWNVFTVRFPEEGRASYDATASIQDILLDIFTQ